ncbi:MAG: M20/M25/M40 family metallo-hydrolase [Acidobacteria bacterium]|nr:M20/M25/M40 family metallo-hydrolase [Acidobacteriota bacterium]MBV9070189.1 M20/M25/M40 family metallo-hydrolase [Acidobacteriota bacterium]MBV9185593.1 M20/M25/M40 family metallo-hydrolase [Acidobacteriota bacterium]
MKRGGASALLFALLAAIAGTLFVRMSGPTPLPENAPATSFSATRALRFERDLLGGDVPHPAGSAAHDAVRDRLAAQFRALGYDVTIQHSFACSAWVTCSPIANVIARTPGDARPNALVLAAHYDSVPAGPGVSDDGVGVATLLETARALRNEQFRNPIVYLVTDAEEVALLGAEGFVADAGLLRNTAAVINVEARGTSGPSFLFETSRHNAWLARVIAHALPRPATSSLYYDIYELLPNDTDLTVFKRAGLAGIGFAHIGRPVHYHTPLDNFANVTPSTVQHHGDHVLAMARALAGIDLRQTSSGNAVWFDVLSLFVIWWPQQFSLAVAIIAFVLLLVAAFNLRTRPRSITIGVAGFFLSLIAAFLVGLGVNWLAGLCAHGAVWVAHPGPMIAAAWMVGLLISIIVAQRLSAYAGVSGLFFGQALCWSAIAIALAIVLPGGSYLAIVPAMACAICALLRLHEGTAAIVCASITAILVFPFGFALYDALGRPILPVVAVLIALAATTFAPFLAAVAALRRPLVASIAAAIVACVAMALIVPAYETNSPRHINIEYVDDGVGPRWQTDVMLPEIAKSAHFTEVPQKTYEWTVPPSRAYLAAAPELAIPPAEAQVVRDVRQNGRHLTLRIRSNRNAPRIALIFHAPSFAALRVNGITPPPMTRFRGGLAPGWHRVAVRGATEATIEIDLTRDEPIEAVIIDGSYGLPSAGAALAHARDASMALPVQEGDLTNTLRRMKL